MTVDELRHLLFDLDQQLEVVIRDPHLGVFCHVQVDSLSHPFAVEIESNGVIVTEEDVA